MTEEVLASGWERPSRLPLEARRCGLERMRGCCVSGDELLWAVIHGETRSQYFILQTVSCYKKVLIYYGVFWSPSKGYTDFFAGRKMQKFQSMKSREMHPTQAWDTWPQSPSLPLKWKRGILARRFATMSTLMPLPMSVAAENMPTPGEHSCVAFMCLHDVFCNGGLKKKVQSHEPDRHIYHRTLALMFNSVSFCHWLLGNLILRHCCSKYWQFRVSEGSTLEREANSNFKFSQCRQDEVFFHFHARWQLLECVFSGLSLNGSLKM